MPERHRTHRLEDQSRKRFESLIPNLWAIRAKHPDYGIDLEIEHFSEDGKATGLLFNVQLRATDDIKKRSKMPVKLDQLAYFEALDTPTIIVRYCSVDDSFHWCWHFNRVQSVSTAGQKTVTLTFDDSHRWTDDAPLQIDRTLRALRNAKKHSASDPILLIIEAGDLTPHENFHFESAVHDLIDAVPWLASFMPATHVSWTMLFLI